MEGFQLWLNLPAKNKMIAPFYRDIPAEAIPEFVTAEGIHVRVIAGRCQGQVGAVERPDTEPLFLDLHMPAGTVFTQVIAPEHNAFTYTYRGLVQVGETPVPDRHMAILANDGATAVTVRAMEDAKLLIVAGQPLREPIVQHGPFVMNTHAQIEQTLRDYREGKFVGAKVEAR
jgi:redox-sensitive bicupin YhaK (pirin superfamily)